jgi:hypothetical protein
MTGNAFVQCSPYQRTYLNYSHVVCLNVLSMVFLVVQLLLKPILANLRLVVPTLNVDKSMAKLFVLVFLDTLELLQLVDLNASQVVNVPRTRPVTIKSVLTLVQAHVESMQTAKSEIITPFVLACKDTQAILSPDVKFKLFNKILQRILVSLRLVVQTLNAKLLEIKLHAHVCQQ